MRRRLLLVLALAIAGWPAAAAARAPRTLRLHFPRVTVPAGRDLQACWIVRVPATEPFDLAEWRVRHRGTSEVVAVRHFLVSQYLGDDAGEVPGPGARPVSDRGCLEIGWQPPAAADRRVLVAGNHGTRGFFPSGLALALAPTPASPGRSPSLLVFVLAGNWVNGSDRARAVSATVELRRAAPGQVQRRLAIERHAEADAAILVPPFASAAVSGRWSPPRDACVFEVSGAFHRRGRFLGIDRLDAAGNPANPQPTVADPLDLGRSHLFGVTDYTDPSSRVFPFGLLVRAGESLAWSCTFDNGQLGPVRLGCETGAGVVPGSPGGGPAATCAATAPRAPMCAGGTGACVPANVVGGPAPGDETCALVVSWREASGGGCERPAEGSAR